MTKSAPRILTLELPTPYPVGDVNVYLVDGDEPALVAANRTFIEQREGIFLEKISGGVTVPYELVRAVFGELDAMNQFLGISETIAYLDMLERDGTARVDWDGDRISILART